MVNFIRDRYENYDVLTGEVSAPKPGILCMNNARLACNMLYKHIKNRSGILIHGDVDCDGIGSTYVAIKFIEELNMRGRVGICINKEKVHGISDKHIPFFNTSGAGLVIIVDSATNDVEYIEKLNCDVLVIDHHDILHDKLSGDTAGGKYIIVNNNINSEDVEFGTYIADDRMSGALVVYELLRLYQHMFKAGDILNSLMLYQWVGVTLLTDVVPTTLRNQYYMDKTVHNLETESGLKKILKSLTPYKHSVDKSFINYTLAPAFNSAIRAGESSMALNCAINEPGNVEQLLHFREIQKTVCEGFMDGVLEYGSYAIKDVSRKGISKNYNGLLANKVLNETNKTSVVHEVVGDYAEGSFRGKYKGIDYRKLIDGWNETTVAQGHKGAFGIRAKVDDLPQILSEATKAEETADKREYVTAGRMIEEYKGIHHIDDFEVFRKEGLLWRLAMANSKLSSEEEIVIVAANDGLEVADSVGKILYYDVLGLRCKAFEQITAPLVEIYVEYTKELSIYIKNKWR